MRAATSNERRKTETEMARRKLFAPLDSVHPDSLGIPFHVHGCQAISVTRHPGRAVPSHAIVRGDKPLPEATASWVPERLDVRARPSAVASRIKVRIMIFENGDEAGHDVCI